MTLFRVTSLLIVIGVPAAAQAHVQDLEPYTDSVAGTLVTFDMIPIPAGVVTIDGNTSDVPAFWIGRTEVPWELYDVFALRLDVPRSQRLGVDAESRPSNPYGAPDHGFGHRGFAAISITYHAAVAFCAWLSEKTGHTYRVPTDAEWTRAVEAGFPNGVESMDAVAWHAGNSDQHPHPVATAEADQNGVHDMLGNVVEWVTGVSGPLVRGGSWRDAAPDDVGPTARAYQDPSWNSTDPQIPKSRWWLSDGTFVSFRIIRIP